MPSLLGSHSQKVSIPGFMALTLFNFALSPDPSQYLTSNTTRKFARLPGSRRGKTNLSRVRDWVGMTLLHSLKFPSFVVDAPPHLRTLRWKK